MRPAAVSRRAIPLLRDGVVSQSDATTMSSTGLLLPTQQSTHLQGSVGMTPVTATSTTTGAMYIPPRQANVTSMQQATIPIEVDWRRNPRIPVAGRVLVIEAADEVPITYRIE
jgi:hypothetical protein